MIMTPRQIVTELDRYIIGQEEAKKAVAVALRNRYRRSRLSDAEREEITPKNIILKGPTGVGKTEIARRLARLVKAPFVKVEATKFTEVGYVGRDVESMVKDLVETSVRMVQEEKFKDVKDKAEKSVEKKLVDIIYIKQKAESTDDTLPFDKESIAKDFRDRKFDNLIVEVEVFDSPRPVEVIPGSGTEIDIGAIFGGTFGQKKKKRKMKVSEAHKIFLAEESEKLIDKDSIYSEALSRAEQEGIIFIDEIDKVAGKGNQNGPDVSREGVQRDILPIVEGCTVNTKYGQIKTDFVLFIAAGAFHVSKVDDLIPELQGRFPVIVELNSLTKEDFYSILIEPENAIIKQYKTLLAVDNIDLEFTEDSLQLIAEVAVEENINSENLGARRLHTIVEFLLEDISFNAGGDYPLTKVQIDSKFVLDKMQKQLKNRNLKKYIL